MRILVVDDDLGSRLVAEAAVLALGHECVTAADGDAAWELIQQLSPDVVVSDRTMPGLDGLELCRRIRARVSDHYTYIVLVTALDWARDVLDGMEAGADDYIPKPLNPFDLEVRLLAARRVTELHAELSRARAELARQASTDPLTGLRNRLGLADDLEQLHATSSRYGRAYSVALCDVDHFKRYNDTYGHVAGDQVLRAVAATLGSGVRDVDRVYRYGGEEFLLVLPEQTSAAGHVVVQRIVDVVRGLGLEHRAGGPSGLLTMSAGIATCAPGSGMSADRLLLLADEALYAAKAAGRDQVAVAGADRLDTPDAC